jgi:tetratricopeptide (TPR) repeat protein
MSNDLRRAAEDHFQRGNQFHEDGNRDRAIVEWQEAIHLDPAHASAHYNLGIAYADEGENELAMQELREAIRLDPFDVDARWELAQIYLEEDRFNDAVNQLRQALNLAPDDGETAHLLAQAYLDHEMWDEASGALEMGAMLEEDADLWFRLGQAYARENRRDDAILAYRRALVCQPGHRDADEALRVMHIPVEEPPDPDETEDE